MELVVRGVSHRYDELHALDDISLTVRPGETFVIIGPSGCGKSTLLGIMGGMLEPSAGTVEVQGALPEGCLNPFTYVFQDFALLPWRTARGNVALALEHHPLSAAERAARIDEVLALCGLADFADAYPKQLSGGMRQRVGIARAIAVRPAVLFLDEPLSALDAQTRELLMEDLLAIWARERTMSLYVTHNLHEALRVGDRIGVLSRRPGRLKQIVEVDIPRDRRARPEHAARLALLHDSLWASIRGEAQVADREVQNV
ncbi:MAG TPA: ABC transporter ATP-binding protein [Alphaproteobacteria bacterium]|jgi:NitT/TauT family transport system ATP-binding protein|nr:ABC transporter ATP-binding protein [Alphaproteobacteria bacterium]